MPPIPGDRLPGARQSQSFVTRGPLLEPQSAKDTSGKSSRFKQDCSGLIALFLLLSVCLFAISACTPSGDERAIPQESKPDAAQATEEYLASLPKWEREAIQQREETRRMNELRRNPGTHMALKMEESLDGCRDWYGTDHCFPYILELKKSDRCEWEPVEYVPWSIGEELPNNVQYAGYFGNEKGEMASEFIMTFSLIRLEWFDCWRAIGKHPPRAQFN